MPLLQTSESFFSGFSSLASSSSLHIEKFPMMSSIYSSVSPLSELSWFFNVSSCESYPTLSAQMPDSMDLCVWRGWFYVSSSGGGGSNCCVGWSISPWSMIVVLELK